MLLWYVKSLVVMDSAQRPACGHRCEIAVGPMCLPFSAISITAARTTSRTPSHKGAPGVSCARRRSAESPSTYTAWSEVSPSATATRPPGPGDQVAQQGPSSFAAALDRRRRVQRMVADESVELGDGRVLRIAARAYEHAEGDDALDDGGAARQQLFGLVR